MAIASVHRVLGETGASGPLRNPGAAAFSVRSSFRLCGLRGLCCSYSTGPPQCWENEHSGVPLALDLVAQGGGRPALTDHKSRPVPQLGNTGFCCSLVSQLHHLLRVRQAAGDTKRLPRPREDSSPPASQEGASPPPAGPLGPRGTCLQEPGVPWERGVFTQ